MKGHIYLPILKGVWYFFNLALVRVLVLVIQQEHNLFQMESIECSSFVTLVISSMTWKG